MWKEIVQVFVLNSQCFESEIVRDNILVGLVYQPDHLKAFLVNYPVHLVYV